MSGLESAAFIEVPGWKHIYSGKVRDLYVPIDAGQGGPASASGGSAAAPGGSAGSASDQVLVVASDRISAYDFVLESTIPDKGAVLTRLSQWWFEQLADVVPNHVVSARVPDAVAGRAMICRKLDMFPVECVARGYLTGSGLADYQKTGAICGVELPEDLGEADRLPQPIFTPATKADVGEHDQNVSFDAVAEQIGPEDAAELRQLTLAVYARAEQIARERGIILADTKFEFGRTPEGRDIILGDEVLTPDSSRFWDAASWSPGTVQPSFDKQFVRDWLTGQDSGWDRGSDAPPPALPEDVVEKTRSRYIEAYELLTGTKF
ncbi:phosphoribosylaminoimidazolesuccinocarboxamide synthase [Saxibacter everestensis]|uniref:Phosphoribosylaminoimidazole-succinocarboxamide synthase n=1 Tax=Saxibacter everestensis TaxID=2909229 RepID=A0ABY8QW46_9MICO|nr:phosphoribosylaminoimidazolesuccinocarboxamide synthase [Brevibacteriaceae bacterium ZFBP1038]